MRKYILGPLLLISVLLAVACAPVAEPTLAPSEDGAAEEATQATGTLPEAVEIKRASDVPRLTAEETKELVDSGAAVIMDARALDSYNVEHITGALPRPTVALSELGDALDPEQLIITYCT